jgi:hypothetical protein
MQDLQHRRLPRASHAVLAAAVALAATAIGGDALAQDAPTQQCVEAYNSSQELRIDGKWRQAREKAAVCAQDTCPAAVRAGCTKWLRELIDGQPSIVVVVRSGGTDITDAIIDIDGLRADTTSGRPVELDPGKHVVRMTLPGKPPVSRDIVVVEGAKNRTIEFDVGRPEAPAAIGATVPPAEAPSAVPPGAIVFGGLGLASLAAFGVLAASGTRDLDTLHATCGKTRSCPEDEVDDAKKKIIIGDVFLAAGVVGMGVAIGWTIAHHAGSSTPSDERAAAMRVSLSPAPGGGFGFLTGSY